MLLKDALLTLENGYVLVDVGLKSEGRIELREFTKPGQDPEVKIGDQVDVYVERLEDQNGEAVLSREKARREEVWAELEEQHNKGERVTGVIPSRVKGGFTVDLGGAIAFLPGSQVDIRPIKRRKPINGYTTTIPGSEDGPRKRQHRCFTSCRSGREP